MLYNTFQTACQERGLLEDDNHCHQTLRDASISDAPKRLSYLFAVILDVCGITYTNFLWKQHEGSLAEDFYINT